MCLGAQAATSSNVGGVVCPTSQYQGGPCLCGLKLPTVKELSWVEDKKVQPIVSGTVVYGVPHASLASKGTDGADSALYNNKDLVSSTENESSLLQIVLGFKGLNKGVSPIYAAVSQQDQIEKQIKLDSPLLNSLTPFKSEQKISNIQSAANEDKFIVVQKTYVYAKPK